MIGPLAALGLVAPSYRDLPAGGGELRALLRDISDRLERLENGGATAGIVSFGPVILIGDVRIRIEDAGGDSREVVFENVLTGATSTITL